MEIPLAFVFLFVSIFVAAVTFWDWFIGRQELKRQIKRRLRFESNVPRVSIFLFLCGAFDPLNYFLLRRLGAKREALENRLFGARVALTVEQFFGMKELLAIVSLLLGVAFLPVGEFAQIIAGGAFGFFVPDIWLSMKLQQRRKAVVSSLPDTVDLLSICVDAGLDFIASARWIIEKSKQTAFVEELAFMLHEIKVGKPRREALKDLSRRISAPDVTAFSRTLIQADRMGTPIAETLIILAEDTRERYFRRLERLALQSPMKMLLPLIFFILPVVGVIVGGPIIIQFMSGNLMGGMGAGMAKMAK